MVGHLLKFRQGGETAAERATLLDMRVVVEYDMRRTSSKCVEYDPPERERGAWGGWECAETIR